jgi:hypothetical protein
MEILLVILLVLATYRGTRLITRDKLPVIDLPREAFVLRWGTYQDAVRVLPEGHQERNILLRSWLYVWGRQWPSVDGRHRTNLVMKSLAYLWECDWCMSVWVGGLIVYTSTQFVNVPYPVLLWLATSAMTGLLTTVEEKLDK